MIDTGLLVSVVVVYAAVWASGRFRLFRAGDVLDFLVSPALLGLAVGRLVAVVVEDPNALRRVGDLLIVRSGVEFWPGVAAGAAALLTRARREGVPLAPRAAAAMPAALVAYGAYAATCFVREGCFGPMSSVGLVPPVGGTRQFPVEFVVAGAVVALAFVVDRLHWHGWQAAAAGLGGLATIRLVAGVWLPRVDAGWTRLEFESAAALLFGFALWIASLPRLARGAAVPRTTDPLTPG